MMKTQIAVIDVRDAQWAMSTCSNGAVIYTREYPSRDIVSTKNERDARFICCAVNSYRELLAACKLALEYFQAIEGTLEQQHVLRLQAAIAKAEGRV